MDTIRGKFFKQHLLSDQFLDLIEKNKRPMDELMSYYQCAIMEVETKFKVLNQEYSLEYDRNPIEGIKTRVKSYDSILRKIRRKNIPMTLEGIEENIRDIAESESSVPSRMISTNWRKAFYDRMISHWWNARTISRIPRRAATGACI